MELDLTSDQELLRRTTESFISDRMPLASLRDLIDAPARRLPVDYLRGAARLGWFALLVPEDLGGGSVSGNGLLDLAIIAEERGRCLQPGPFSGTNVVAHALAVAGSPEHRSTLLPALLSGERSATWAVTDGGAAHDLGAAVSAERTGDRVVLDGTATLVQDAQTADWILVTARQDGNVAEYLVPRDARGLTVTELQTLDVTQQLCRVDLAHVEVTVDAAVGVPSSTGLFDDLLDHAAVLVCSETVGALEALFRLTCQYALDRMAFARPIGSFQAVKHQLADISLSVEASTAVAAAATRSLQEATLDASQCVSMAKAWIADVAPVIAQSCFQVFGGIGFSWEHDCHLYLRRVTTNAELYGSADWHRARLVDLSTRAEALT